MAEVVVAVEVTPPVYLVLLQEILVAVVASSDPALIAKSL